METAGQSPRRGDGNRHPAREWAQSIAATGPALAVAGVVSTVPSDMTDCHFASKTADESLVNGSWLHASQTVSLEGNVCVCAPL